MKKISLILLLAMSASGCHALPNPADLIATDYTTVNFQDGISLEEALIIAKKEVNDHTPPKSYIVSQPRLITDFKNLPHQDAYWFVSFEEVLKGTTPMVYMVAIRKDSGKIVFARSYSPLNEWVLEAALLKLHEYPEE